jgi:hypothetical protein
MKEKYRRRDNDIKEDVNIKDTNGRHDRERKRQEPELAWY